MTNKTKIEILNKIRDMYNTQGFRDGLCFAVIPFLCKYSERITLDGLGIKRPFWTKFYNREDGIFPAYWYNRDVKGAQKRMKLIDKAIKRLSK